MDSIRPSTQLVMASASDTAAPVQALGIDLGDKRVGVAKTDPSGSLASPLTVLARPKNDEPVFREIAELVDEWSIEIVVVGMPYSLNGDDGPAAQKTRKRINRLRDVISVPVEIYDERMTTTTAARLLQESGIDSRRQRAVIDKVAAAIILQGWLDARGHETTFGST